MPWWLRCRGVHTGCPPPPTHPPRVGLGEGTRQPGRVCPHPLTTPTHPNQNDAYGAVPVPGTGTLGGGASLSAAATTPSLSSAPNPLAAFNTQYRDKADAFDEVERGARAARKAAGRAALKKLLEGAKQLSVARKAKNREDEAAREKAMMDSLEGESWTRVVSLVDLQAGAPPPSVAGKGGEEAAPKKESHVPEPDIARHKDLLISLKAHPVVAAK